MAVTRYGIYDWSRFSADGSGESEIMEKADGDYVSYTDFKKVLDALAESKRDIATLKLKLSDSIGAYRASAYYGVGRVAESILAEFSESE